MMAETKINETTATGVIEAITKEAKVASIDVNFHYRISSVMSLMRLTTLNCDSWETYYLADHNLYDPITEKNTTWSSFQFEYEASEAHEVNDEVAVKEADAYMESTGTNNTHENDSATKFVKPMFRILSGRSSVAVV